MGVALGVAPPGTLAHCFAIRGGGLRPRRRGVVTIQ